MSDSWDEICEAGRLARERLDEGRWVIGDLALLIGKQYSADRIGDFAREINVTKSTAAEYRTVARFYENSARADLLASHPSLSYTHYRTAMRLGDYAAAVAFLDDADANTWTCELASVELSKRLGKPVPPQKLANCEAVLIGVSSAGEVRLEVSDADALDRFREALMAHTVNVQLVVTAIADERVTA